MARYGETNHVTAGFVFMPDIREESQPVSFRLSVLGYRSGGCYGG